MNMTKNNITTEKKQYVQPLLERVKLDNEISLQLESPAGEPTDEDWKSSNNSFNNDPYKGNMA